MLCATSFDGTVQIWIDPTGGSERAIDLAHHSAIVRSATFSHDDRLLATSSMDGTVRVWRTDTWEPVARIAEPTTEFWPQGIAFHPSRPLLATFGDKDRVVRIWQLDIDALLGVTPMEEPVYRNAKVVLLGDTGVGKSGLRLVLTGEPYTPTESTYGRRVWPFDLEEHESGTRRETREILLWDMAGQPGYRLIHQLYLNEVAVALLVFDARQAAGDPLSAVRHWERALRQAQQRQGNQGVPLKRFLVLGRADIQGTPVARERIDGVMREWALDGFFVTSAKEGRGIAELRHAIQTAVDWSVLPEVKSPELFTIVRDFVLTEKRAGRLLVPIDALYRTFSTSRSDAEDPEVRQVFETCISRLENRDLIRRLSFGTLVLLQPELLDAYASAIVQAAEAEELSASGSIPEADALEGRFGMPDSERVPNKQLEKLLLIATIEELLQHQLGLREPAQEGMYLIFPSQFTNVWAETDEPKGQTVSINFEGPVRNLYATVVVRLAHSGLFQADRNDMWKNAAIFAADTGGRCGVSLREFGDGSGQLRLFFQADASGRKTDPQTQHRFEAFVLSHLEKRAIAGSVKLTRRFVCPGCETVVPTAWADGLLARGQLTFRCPVDDVPIPLVEPLQQIEMLREDVGRMDSMADRQRDRRVSEMVVKGKEAIGQFDVFLCYNREDTTAVDTIYQRLLQHKVRPWLDTQNLRPGDVWLDEVEKLVASVKAAAIFVGASSAGPVQGMEIRALLRTFADRKVRIIPVLLPGAEGKPSWSTFLSDFQWVDFQKTTPEPLSQLVYGITGVHPQLQ
jgi:GTPase SAR1 family protein